MRGSSRRERRRRGSQQLLSRKEIQQYIESGELKFDPPLAEKSIEHVSIDLHLGNKFTRFKKPGYLPAIYVDRSLFSADLWEDFTQEEFTLEPGQFVLASTLEKVTVPGCLAGFVEGRSSFARCGVTVHVTAPKIDPGFSGTITLEMANFGPARVMLRATIEKPAQIMFFRLSSPIPEHELYGTGPEDIFQNQTQPIPRS